MENRGQGPNKETKGLHKGTKSRKERKPEDNQLRKGVQDLRKWFERKDLAPEKEPACQNLKTETEEGTKEKEPTGKPEKTGSTLGKGSLGRRT